MTGASADPELIYRLFEPLGVSKEAARQRCLIHRSLPIYKSAKHSFLLIRHTKKAQDSKGRLGPESLMLSPRGWTKQSKPCGCSVPFSAQGSARPKSPCLSPPGARWPHGAMRGHGSWSPRSGPVVWPTAPHREDTREPHSCLHTPKLPNSTQVTSCNPSPTPPQSAKSKNHRFNLCKPCVVVAGFFDGMQSPHYTITPKERSFHYIGTHWHAYPILKYMPLQVGKHKLGRVQCTSSWDIRALAFSHYI